MDRLSRVDAEGMYGGEEDADQYVVLALDPGGTSGWCVLGIHPDAMSGDPGIRILDNVEFWTAGEFAGNEDDQCDEIVELIEAWPGARLVTELFTLRSRVTSSEVFSLERMNAILRWAIRPRYFVYQQPSLAMTTITDDRQKAMGFWIPGREHARDATKHALTFLKRQRDRQAKAAAIANRSRSRAGGKA
jgi:hypothetical protein